RQEVDRCIIDFEAVDKLDDGETDALDIVDAAAEADAGIGLARARTPVVNDDAVDGKGAAAARRFQERPGMRVGRERHRIGKTRFGRNNLQDLAVSGGVTREREHTFRTTAARKGSGDFSGRDRDCAANLCKAHSLPPRCTMRRWLFWILLLAGIPLFHLLEHLHVYADTPEGDADLIIHNAKVVTVDAKFRIAQALAIKGERIIAVGDNAAALKHRGPKTRVIDAGGRTVLPGLYDSHTHPTGAAGSELTAPLPVLR